MAVGKRRLGEALYATNPSMRMGKGMAHKSEAVHSQAGRGSMGMWDRGFGAARLMWDKRWRGSFPPIHPA